MSIDTRTRSSSRSAALRSAIVSDDAVPPKPKSVKTTRLAVVRGKIMATEFLAVASAAFIASAAYHSIVNNFPSLPVEQYIFAALFIATLVSLVSVGFQHFTAIQMRPLHVLVWNGLGAVGLAFSLFLSTIFLLKTAEDYSRGTFIFQVIGVGIAVIGLRTIAYAWIRSAARSGAIEARRVILIGDAPRCAQFSDRLRIGAIQSVASFRVPWGARGNAWRRWHGSHRLESSQAD